MSFSVSERAAGAKKSGILRQNNEFFRSWARRRRENFGGQYLRFWPKFGQNLAKNGKSENPPRFQIENLEGGGVLTFICPDTQPACDTLRERTLAQEWMIL